MFLGTNTRDMMSVSRIFGVVVVVAHVWWLWGSWVECAMCFILRREYLLHCGSSGGFGNKGILETRIDYIHWSYLEFLSSLWKEPCEVVKLVFVGFLLLGYELPFPWSNRLIPWEEIKKKIDPLWSIKLKQ
jgi:hypothetical protein